MPEVVEGMQYTPSTEDSHLSSTTTTTVLDPADAAPRTTIASVECNIDRKHGLEPDLAQSQSSTMTLDSSTTVQDPADAASPTTNASVECDIDREDILEDILGPDLEDSDLSHKLENQLFTRIDYKKRNFITERVARVSEAKELAKDLYGINLREWQAGIPWDLRKGRDVMCIVATGQGKTLVTSIFTGLFKEAYVLFISPLIALMESQVVLSVFMHFYLFLSVCARRMKLTQLLRLRS